MVSTGLVLREFESRRGESRRGKSRRGEILNLFASFKK